MSFIKKASDTLHYVSFFKEFPMEINSHKQKYILQANNISKRFGGLQALNKVSLSLSKGEVLCLAGENGCGKSTLSKIISGVLSPDEGALIFNNQDISKLSPKERMYAGIQIIYQDFSLFPNMRVADNIYLIQQSCESKIFVKRKAGEALAKHILKDIGVSLDIHRLVEDISVAEKQAIAIARAMVQDAKLIIMDEPTAALTDQEIEKLLHIIRRLSQKGISFIFISHKLEEMLDISDRIIVLRNGNQTLDTPTKGLSADDITMAMIGSVIPKIPKRKLQNRFNKTPLLKVKNLYYKNHFSDICFSVQAGEILGLSGRLGAGRTSLAQSIFGIMPAMAGSIKIHGKKVNIKNIQSALDLKIAYVPEDRLTEGLFLSKPIGENIILRAFHRLKNYGSMLNRKKIKKEADFWVNELSIATPSISLNANTLSGGNQQRIVLAKWLASYPDILILNRPTVGVDIGSKYEIHKIIYDIADSGVAVLIISDEYSELKAVSDRILFMEEGKLIKEKIINKNNARSIS